MELLILGGTVFLGRHLVEIARQRGYQVTLFNRGQSNPDLFPDVTQLHGDRDGGLAVLDGRRWDAVIDTSGYLPRLVGDAARRLANHTDHYTFISSISVLANFAEPYQDESAPVGRLNDPTVEVITGETYGPLKALCEETAEAAMPGRVLTIRPGLIVGPHDPTDRYTYWPVRVAQGDDVVAPAPPSFPVQVIDVRDLASWTLDMVAERRTGVYHATGPAAPLTMGELLADCRAVSGSNATINWIDEEFLLAQEVQPWSDMPLWIPSSDPWGVGFSRIDISRALAAGLSFRPSAETIGDTLAWVAEQPSAKLKAGLTREKEQEVLSAWRERDVAS